MNKIINPAIGNGAWPFDNDHVENWAWWENVFSGEELNKIIQLGNSAQEFDGSTFGGIDKKTRNSKVNFFFPNEETHWMFVRLSDIITNMNNRFFKFDLHGINEGLQFTKYSHPHGHYDWHTDKSFSKQSRKLSISIQLNSPEDYDGGELELKFGAQGTVIKKEQGTMTIFPSYVLHRVKPVTRGTRYSLVAWISGPPFK